MVLVRIPARELECFEDLKRQFPKASLQKIFRALALTSGPIAIMNALDKHQTMKPKGAGREKEK